MSAVSFQKNHAEKTDFWQRLYEIFQRIKMTEMLCWAPCLDSLGAFTSGSSSSPGCKPFPFKYEISNVSGTSIETSAKARTSAIQALLFWRKRQLLIQKIMFKIPTDFENTAHEQNVTFSSSLVRSS